MPNGTIRKEILIEANTTSHSVHSSTIKIYEDFKIQYQWPCMNKDMVEFVAQCLTCQLVKVKHQRPARTFNPLHVPQWKQKAIVTDFIIGNPKTKKEHYAISIIVDRFTKSTYFLPISITYNLDLSTTNNTKL